MSDPAALHSVIPGDVAMDASNAALRVYEAVDRRTIGRKDKFVTVRDILDYQPLLNEKTARSGIRECVEKQWLRFPSRGPRGQKAFRVAMAYNPGRNIYELPGARYEPPPPRTKRKRSAPQLASDGTIEHDPQPLCAATTKYGQPCRSHARIGASLCRVHLEVENRRSADHLSGGFAPGDSADDLDAAQRTERARLDGGTADNSSGGEKILKRSEGMERQRHPGTACLEYSGGEHLGGTGGAGEAAAIGDPIRQQQRSALRHAMYRRAWSWERMVEEIGYFADDRPIHTFDDLTSTEAQAILDSLAADGLVPEEVAQ